MLFKCLNLICVDLQFSLFPFVSIHACLKAQVREKFLFVGNGSLLGARLLSFSKNLLREAERIALMMTNLELSNQPTFMNEFTAAMFLPHTDVSAFPQVMERLYRMKREIRSERMVEGQL